MQATKSLESKSEQQEAPTFHVEYNAAPKCVVCHAFPCATAHNLKEFAIAPIPQPLMHTKAYAMVTRCRTQKAKGIVALQTSSINNLSTGAVLQATIYPHRPPRTYPFFGRPCPMTPRHGFVDSRKVANESDFIQLIKETAKAEKNAEIVCMPFISGKWSGILTPAGFSVGPGHDGATSGVNAYMIPAQAKHHDFNTTFHLPTTEAGIKDTPYVEVVHNDKGNKLEVVQLRDGPACALTTQYIPEAFTVTNVVKAEGDLLEWESRARAFPKGTIVWHPGGVMSSHYAVHCILNHVPIVIQDDAPKVGSAFEVFKPKELNSENYLTLAKYIMAYDAWFRAINDDDGTRSNWNNVCRLSIGTMHAQAQWDGSDHLLKLRAFGIISTLRFIAMSCIGEDRHYNSTGPGQNGFGKKRRLVIPDDCEDASSRESVYTTMHTSPPWELLTQLVNARDDFKDKGWREGFGGSSWAKCAQGGIDLAKHLTNFLAKPNEKNWRVAAETWNRAVNFCHNNGKVLNKFIPEAVMDQCAVVPSIGLTSPVLWDVLMVQPPKMKAKSLRTFANALKAASAKVRSSTGPKALPPDVLALTGKTTLTTPKEYVDGETEGQFYPLGYVSGDGGPGTIKVQINDVGEYYKSNREYGATFHANLNEGDYAWAKTALKTLTSLTGSHTKYHGPVTIQFSKGKPIGLTNGKVNIVFESVQINV